MNELSNQEKINLCILKIKKMQINKYDEELEIKLPIYSLQQKAEIGNRISLISQSISIIQKEIENLRKGGK